MACARDPQSRGRDVQFQDRDRDVGQVVRDESLGRSRDRDIETETTSLMFRVEK
jgi:hypothetical protein